MGCLWVRWPPWANGCFKVFRVTYQGSRGSGDGVREGAESFKKGWTRDCSGVILRFYFLVEIWITQVYALSKFIGR